MRVFPGQPGIGRHPYEEFYPVGTGWWGFPRVVLDDQKMTALALAGATSLRFDYKLMAGDCRDMGGDGGVGWMR